VGRTARELRHAVPIESKLQLSPYSVHNVNVENEEAIRARLADDPWANDVLTIKSVEPWSVWLRAPEGSPSRTPRSGSGG
jgi:hypothetical protein